METFLLDTHQLMLGSMVLNATLMVSFLGVTLSQRAAFNRLENALTDQGSSLAGSSVAGLLTSSIQENEADISIEVPELLSSVADSESTHDLMNQDEVSYSTPSIDSVSEAREVKPEIIVFF